jgi:hypothetical protein
MAANPTMAPTLQPGQLPEAPVSWTARYVSAEGFECLLTLRGQDLATVMAQAKRATEAMSKANCKPTAPRGGQPAPAAAASAPAQIAAPAGQAPMCPAHNKPMRRNKRNDGWFCPVKIADNDGTGKPVYCQSRIKDQ